MFLAVDIGNSDVVLGLYARQQWLHLWRVPSQPPQTEDFYQAHLQACLAQAQVPPHHVEKAILSSVVPSLAPVWQQVLAQALGRPPLVMGPALYARLPLAIERPEEIGADLVANALAAYLQYRQTCIVADFGTALTFTVVSGEGRLLGVSIAPGLRTAMRALSQNTAKLPEVPLEVPASAIGRNTAQAMQAGILHGYTGLVGHMLAQIRAELGQRCIALATGGLASAIPALRPYFYAIQPTLTLDGLRLASSYEAVPEG